MMKLGLVSAILPDFTFEEVMDYASEVGFSCVEVCCWPVGKAERRYAGVTHIDIDGITREKMDYYLDYAKKAGVAISSLGYYPNPMDANEEARKVAAEHINALIDVSADMGINMVTTFIGKDKAKTVEENLVLYKEIWTPIVRHAEARKVKIGIENCPMYRSTGLRPAAPVRYQTSGERQRNQSRYSSWKQRGIWCPPTA